MAGTAGAAGTVTAPPNSFGSVSVNGQLVGAQTTGAYYPKNYGGGISFTPAGSPVTIPPNVGYGMGPGAESSTAGNTPVPTASLPGTGHTSPSTTTRGAHNGPFMGSPAMWALLLMAFGVLWIRYVHWRPNRKKPASED